LTSLHQLMQRFCCSRMRCQMVTWTGLMTLEVNMKRIQMTNLDFLACVVSFLLRLLAEFCFLIV